MHLKQVRVMPYSDWLIFSASIQDDLYYRYTMFMGKILACEYRIVYSENTAQVNHRIEMDDSITRNPSHVVALAMASVLDSLMISDTYEVTHA